jgi:putative drug exporter of the RND superfamily
MKALGAGSVRRRWGVLIVWVVALLALAGGVLASGIDFKTATNMPDSESSKAYALMASAGSPSGSSGRIVWHVTGTQIADPAVKARAASMLDRIRQLPGVTAVVSPYDKAGASQVNARVGTAFATVSVDGHQKLDQIRTTAAGLGSSQIEVAVGGGSFDELPSPSHGMEAVGLAAAFVLLMLMFGSAWASLLPLITGIIGVCTSLLAVLLATHVLDIPSEAITMGSLIGLGVGIDYALFILNRHRKALLRGRSPAEAAGEALTTSGRAVLFAGSTVVVALLGMAVINLSVLTSMAQAAAVTVVFTVLAAVTLLPALLGFLGLRVLSRRQRAALAAGQIPAGPARTLAARWSGRLERHPVLLGFGALLVVVAMASPVATIRVGDADNSAAPEGSVARTYFDLTSRAFGEGFDAALLMVARTPDASARRAFTELLEAVSTTRDVTTVIPLRSAGSVSQAVVMPASSAQTVATTDLVNHLRDNLVPAAEKGTQLQVYIGGQTATNIDLSAELLGRLPMYLGLIAVLGFLLLAIAFRSVLVPLLGAASNLATICAGLGAVTAIFQHGWGIALFSVGSGAPIMYFVPVMVVGVVFGLSMDYQVFLVSRIHEEWTRTEDNTEAVRVGTAETGRVIATAAMIMLSVFASFSFGGERIVSAIGIGLAAAVLVDAFVVRLTLVPALMKGLGRANWAYPAWADRITPRVALESSEERAPEPVRDDIHTERLGGPAPAGVRRGS